jgi:myo-inositol-1(or 4)-monophosphatase
VTTWLETCRLCVADIGDVLARLPTRVEREPVLRLGQGGDDTTALDQAAEDVVVARLAARAEDFVLVSEELGERTFGSGGQSRVVVDPIDGSVNAKRGIPFFSFSLAVAEGPTMGDVGFGYVYDFGSGEEWSAKRGRGAFLGGEPIGDVRPKDRIEILSFEGTTTPAIAERIEGVIGLAGRLRVMGSLA